MISSRIYRSERRVGRSSQLIARGVYQPMYFAYLGLPVPKSISVFACANSLLTLELSIELIGALGKKMSMEYVRVQLKRGLGNKMEVSNTNDTHHRRNKEYRIFAGLRKPTGFSAIGTLHCPITSPIVFGHFSGQPPHPTQPS